MKHWMAAVALAGISSWAQADALGSLEQFMKSSQAGEASFTQTVTSPAKEGQAPRVNTSSGSFAFQRPGKFKFLYKKPFGSGRSPGRRRSQAQQAAPSFYDCAVQVERLPA